MRTSGCLHPQRVWNKYISEFIYAPCGTCPVCLRRKSSNWTQRLIQERYSWKYCVFFTLTYSPDNVPTLKMDERKTYLYDLSHVHYSEQGDVLIDLNDEYRKMDNETLLKCEKWINRLDGSIHYLSVGDGQRFIKRLRINLKRKIDGIIKEQKEQGIKVLESAKDSGIRYFLIGEYGETTLRPHMHGLLFFNNELTASYIQDLIVQSWKFGNTDSSFVSSHNASYVSGYVNSSANLPPILLHKRIRPFALFSKHPFIGSLCHSSKEVKKIFFSASPDHVIFNHEKSAFENVPLWRSYINKLYPKISGFSKFSHSDRVNIYRAYERYEKLTDNPNYLQFRDWLIYGFKGWYKPSLYDTYVKTILGVSSLYRMSNDNLSSFDGILYRFYTISARVYHQSRSFEIPVREYVSIIERFYDNCEKRKLKIQYDYEQQLAEQNHLDNALAFDREFVRTITNLEVGELSEHEILALQSLGIDIDKFYSDNPRERELYRASSLPETCDDYCALSLDSEVWLKEHTKTKKKNDYIMAHPELQNLLWGDSPLDNNI